MCLLPLCIPARLRDGSCRVSGELRISASRTWRNLPTARGLTPVGSFGLRKSCLPSQDRVVVRHVRLGINEPCSYSTSMPKRNCSRSKRLQSTPISSPTRLACSLAFVESRSSRRLLSRKLAAAVATNRPPQATFAIVSRGRQTPSAILHRWHSRARCRRPGIAPKDAQLLAAFDQRLSKVLSWRQAVRRCAGSRRSRGRRLTRCSTSDRRMADLPAVVSRSARPRRDSSP